MTSPENLTVMEVERCDFYDWKSDSFTSQMMNKGIKSVGLTSQTGELSVGWVCSTDSKSAGE